MGSQARLTTPVVTPVPLKVNSADYAETTFQGPRRMPEIGDSEHLQDGEKVDAWRKSYDWVVFVPGSPGGIVCGECIRARQMGSFAFKKTSKPGFIMKMPDEELLREPTILNCYNGKKKSRLLDHARSKMHKQSISLIAQGRKAPDESVLKGVDADADAQMPCAGEKKSPMPGAYLKELPTEVQQLREAFVTAYFLAKSGINISEHGRNMGLFISQAMGHCPVGCEPTDSQLPAFHDTSSLEMFTEHLGKLVKQRCGQIVKDKELSERYRKSLRFQGLHRANDSIHPLFHCMAQISEYGPQPGSPDAEQLVMDAVDSWMKSDTWRANKLVATTPPVDVDAPAAENGGADKSAIVPVARPVPLGAEPI